MPVSSEAYIVAFTRSAFTKAKRGGFRFTRTDDLSAVLLQGLLQKIPTLESSRVDDVMVGCANPEGEQGLQIGRQISLRAFGKEVPGMTINRYCASGLESLAIATAKIRTGMANCIVAGGVESMSMVPLEGYKLSPSYQLVTEHADYLVGMGLTAEAVAKKYNINREQQDLFAFQSHAKAAIARQKGIFKEEIQAVQVTEQYATEDGPQQRVQWVDTDDGIRENTSLDALAALKPVFEKNGTVTAGNSSQTTDGAAFHVLVSEKLLKELNLHPLGRIVSSYVAGVDPLYMGLGPCAAIPGALHQAGLRNHDIQLIELNEAFAAQALAVIRISDLDPELVNVHGGAIALGHPLGSSGARLAMTLLLELKRRKQRYGLVTACVGGGQGIAAVLESF